MRGTRASRASSPGAVRICHRVWRTSPCENRGKKFQTPSPVKEAFHVPVLLEEAVSALNVREGKTYVDGTFGRGGHSAAILARLGLRGRLLALDQDPAAHADRAFEDPRLELIHARFSTMT